MTRLFKFIIPYRKTLILVVVLLFLQTLGTLYIPTLTADIVNNGIVYGDIPYIIRTGGIMLLFAVLTGVFAILGTWSRPFSRPALAGISETRCSEKPSVFQSTILTALAPRP